VVLVLGSELNDISTRGYRSLGGPDATIIQVDIDRGVFGRGHSITRAIHADLRAFLPAITRAAAFTTRRLRPPIRQGSRVEQPEALRDARSPLRPAYVIRELVRAAPPHARFVSDIGEHMMFALHYLEVTEPDQFFLPLGSGAMGTGLAMAMGLQGGLPDVPVVCITGDGCMEMHGMELVTAVAERIPVVIAVFNDARMGMVRFGLQKIFGRSLDYGTRPVDFAALARSVGAEGRTVSSADDLSPGLFERREPGVPLVLDVRIDPDEFAPANNRVDQIAKTQEINR
jgi:acetolactate synthase-1/2/3 large subunit